MDDYKLFSRFFGRRILVESEAEKERQKIVKENYVYDPEEAKLAPDGWQGEWPPRY